MMSETIVYYNIMQQYLWFDIYKFLGYRSLSGPASVFSMTNDDDRTAAELRYIYIGSSQEES